MLFLVAVMSWTLVPHVNVRTSPLCERIERPRTASAVLKLDDQEKIKELLGQIDSATVAASEARRAREEAPGGARKISVMGARLDEDVVNLKPGDGLDAKDQWVRLFDEGNVAMQRGSYKAAVTAFTRAVAAVPGGLTGRKGGQYAIYLAQALQASERKVEAMGLLRRCGGHTDRDVRKIADSALYVMQAPQLKLDSENFVQIPKLNIADDWEKKRAVRQEKEPPPEKYSLEWYVLEAEKRGDRPVADPEPVSPALGALLLGALLAAAAAALAQAQGG